jgi:hypothetical protein
MMIGACVIFGAFVVMAYPQDAPKWETPADVPARVAADSLDPPVRLSAADGILDSGPSWGHSGPCLHDVDGDGRRDLIVGDFSGLFHFYRNEGTDREPRYAAAVNLQAGGVDAEVPIGCCIGSSPHFADLDADGHADLISGSYDPGEIYLFRGQGGGKFAARETIQDTARRPILLDPDTEFSSNSFGSWPTTVDWDDDGDLDLLVGTFDGFVFLRRNQGMPNKPAFSATNEWVQCGAKPVRVPGAAHASPVTADWDGDGLWDLVLGSADGGVYWYRNIGRRGAPAFDRPVTLVAEHGGDAEPELIEAGRQPTPGFRSQIAVADYDGDGRLDLLLGDFRRNLHLKANLSAAERQAFEKEYADAPRRKREGREAMAAASDALRERLKSHELKGIPESDWSQLQYLAKWQPLQEAMEESPAFQAAFREYLGAQLLPFLDRPDWATKMDARFPAVAHGYVWLFKRRPAP